ncbi:hypothetical protein [Streptomyces sp. NPDC096153]
MAVMAEERRRELWERAERMRIGVAHAMATRAAIAAQRARRGSGGAA